MSKKTKELEYRIKYLEEKVDNLIETNWAYKWLIDHPAGVDCDIRTDFRTTPDLGIDYTVKASYYNNITNKVITFTPIMSGKKIHIKHCTFKRSTGDFELTFTKGGCDDTATYLYKKNMYQVGSRVELLIDWYSNGNWKSLPYQLINDSYVFIP